MRKVVCPLGLTGLTGLTCGLLLTLVLSQITNDKSVVHNQDFPISSKLDPMYCTIKDLNWTKIFLIPFPMHLQMRLY